MSRREAFLYVIGGLTGFLAARLGRSLALDLGRACEVPASTEAEEPERLRSSSS